MAKTFTTAGIAALALGVAAFSAAQTNGPTGYSVRVGAFFPNSGSSLIDVGVDYKLKSVNVPDLENGARPTYIGLALDYYGDNNSYAIPLVVTYNARLSRNFVGFGGIGVDYSKGNADDAKFGFAAQLGASYEFATDSSQNNPIFVQAKYYFTRENDLRGFMVGVGYRF